MVTIEFAPSLRRHVDCATQQVAAGSLREALEAALMVAPALAHYVFDDQRQVRKHVALFVNQHMVQDRSLAGLAVQNGDKVLVIQALTGG